MKTLTLIIVLLSLSAHAQGVGGKGGLGGTAGVGGGAVVPSISVVGPPCEAPTIASGTTMNCTLSVATANGDRGICLAHSSTGNTTAFTGLAQTGVTWTKVVSNVASTAPPAAEIWFSSSASSAGTSIVGTLTASASNAANQTLVCMNVHGVTALDASSNTPTGSGTAMSLPLTTLTANTIAVYVVRAGSVTSGTNYSPTNGFTGIAPVSGDIRAAYGYQIFSSTGTYDPALTQTSATAWRGVIASFKP